MSVATTLGVRMARRATLALLLAGCAAAGPTGVDADPTVSRVLRNVCLPYVADDRSMANVERDAGLTRVWREPDPVGARNGVDYERVGPEQRSLTLYDNLGPRVRGWPGLRACELDVNAPAAAVAAAVAVALAGRAEFRRVALAADSRTRLHLCGSGLEPVNIQVSAPSAGRTVVLVHRRPAEGSSCGS